MIIGLAREIKKEEYRVGLTPGSAREYLQAGHTVLVEKGAGEGSGFGDTDYANAGCDLRDRETVFGKAEMVIKVKEPLDAEYDLLREGQILYTYLHLAANRPLTEVLLARGVSGVAYETVMEDDRSLPLLRPMSEIAGRLSVQEGAKYLEKTYGGEGVLLGGVPGIPRGKVVILGGGTVGTNACKIAVGIGAEVTILDLSAQRLAYLDDIFGGRITTLYSNEANIEESLREADVVIGAVLIPGAAAPKLVRREHLTIMKKGAVIVDVAVDQGGCCETTKATYHSDPIFMVDGVVHYCVANMPGAVSLSSTRALTSVTNRYGLLIANEGIEAAAAQSAAIRGGLNTHHGKLTNAAVAEAMQAGEDG
ncbi:MAG: alanine dehydrogenase [Lentisphaerae bacterium]|jgi:alanine dehydrogenase|nr:alanine dehydrogenase [Lentisphaerota bacterium]MBT4818565.1 alanine dehydrogenase [Lentisphaerota bacterium]MBT5610772.1 alanine dehydrogenase [Lentisphaerota bacterium]MBT7060854.1 alanine dehydrogenase [Lentisphaerota bacterium]MBT7841257.1 alanine dehydrogenase [Lentisphaerota bacterium]